MLGKSFLAAYWERLPLKHVVKAIRYSAFAVPVNLIVGSYFDNREEYFGGLLSLTLAVTLAWFLVLALAKKSAGRPFRALCGLSLNTNDNEPKPSYSDDLEAVAQIMQQEFLPKVGWILKFTLFFFLTAFLWLHINFPLMVTNRLLDFSEVQTQQCELFAFYDDRRKYPDYFVEVGNCDFARLGKKLKIGRDDFAEITEQTTHVQLHIKPGFWSTPWISRVTAI